MTATKAQRLLADELVGVISIAVWVAVFGIGATVSSMPYRAVLENVEATTIMRAVALVAALVTYTPTNMAILCCVASITGSSGIRHDDSLEKYRSSVVRGFFVYILLMSGLLLVSGDPFNAPTQGQYIRLAGMSAVFGFIVGWHPGVVAKLMDTVMQAVKLKEAPSETEVVQVTESRQSTEVRQVTGTVQTTVDAQALNGTKAPDQPTTPKAPNVTEIRPAQKPVKVGNGPTG